MAFKIAGRSRSKEAARKPSRFCWSRSWRSEVIVPEDSMGTIIGDLNSRRDGH